MSFSQSVIDCISDYDEGKLGNDPVHVLRTLLQRHGFQDIMARQIVNPFEFGDEADESQVLEIYNGPKELRDRWMESRGTVHDLGVQRALTAQSVATWADLRPLAKGPAGKIFDDLEEFGMRNGVSIPFLPFNSRPMLVSIAGDVAKDITRGELRAIEYVTKHFLNLWILEQPEAQPEFDALSPKEKEILCAAATGLAGAQLSKRFGITDNTLRHYLRNIRQKLGAASMTQAVYLASRYGLVPA